MDNLKTRICNCTKCQLHKSRNRVIFGEGNLSAPIVLVGEAPGADEDKVGRPFIGKSGHLLQKILESCGFTREKHVFLTNIVRCRPPANRVPNKGEVQSCIPFLFEQLECIDPQIVITLGATPLKKLLGDDSLKITQVRGRWIEWQGRLVLPVFHPAALLRNPALKKKTWADFGEVVCKYRELVDASHFSEHV